MHRNQLKDVPIAITYLRRLKSLNLGGNEISYIKPDAFSRNDMLEKLILNRNALETISPRLPVTLTKLSINQNKLRSLDVRSLDRLETLNADGNEITQFPRLPESVKSVSLCSNRLEVDKLTLEGYPKLRSINLENNQGIYAISLCENGSRTDRELRGLNVGKAGVRTIAVDAFACLSRLRYIDISRNQIKDYQPRWFQCKKRLRSIRLSENPWNWSCNITQSLIEIAEKYSNRGMPPKLPIGLIAADTDANAFTHDFENVTCGDSGNRLLD